MDATAPRPAGTPLFAALQELLEHTRARVLDGSRSLGTLSMQRQHAGWLCDRLGARTPIGELGGPQLEQLVARARRLSSRTLAKRLSTLRRALRLAIARGELAELPRFPELAFAPFRKRERLLRSVAEWRRLEAALPPHRAEWAGLALFTGQRASDVERMTWADVDLDARTVRIRSTKTKRPAIVVRAPTLLCELISGKLARLTAAGAAPLPTDRLVDPWPNRGYQLPGACVRVGLPPMNAIDLRHTHYTWAARRLGITPAICEHGGWRSPATPAKHYVSARRRELDLVAHELDSLELEPANDNGKGGGEPST